MLKVLILGNGFDIAHGLPTRYMNFLYACSIVLGIKLEKNIEDYIVDESIIESFRKNLSEKEIVKFKGNSWINYFIESVNKIGDNWIDFEEEIEKVCNYCEEGNRVFSTSGFNKEYRWFVRLNIYGNQVVFDVKKMISDLNQLKELLKKYIKVVDEILINCYSKDIIDFWPDLIISYNYTHTFSKFYNVNVECLYLHGDYNNKIVLGIDNVKSKNHDYNDFTKSIQRSKYDLTFNIDKIFNNDDVNVLFFGLSFGNSDNKTIKQIIEKSKQVFITYYNDNDKSDKIDNLSRYYGNEKLEELLGLERVKFIKQNPLNCLQDNELVERKSIYSLLNNYLVNKDDYDKVMNAFNSYYFGVKIIEKQLEGLLTVYYNSFNKDHAKLVLFFEKYLKEINENNVLYFTNYKKCISAIANIKSLHPDMFK